jgi:hypothetical protein
MFLKVNHKYLNITEKHLLSTVTKVWNVLELEKAPILTIVKRHRIFCCYAMNKAYKTVVGRPRVTHITWF